jgi:hypothetical protein
MMKNTDQWLWWCAIVCAFLLMCVLAWGVWRSGDTLWQSALEDIKKLVYLIERIDKFLSKE